MTRFKFRAWDKYRNQMAEDFVLAPTSPTWAPFIIRGTSPEVTNLLNDYFREMIPGHYTLTDWSDYRGIDDYIVMQWTGLKDKNEVDIYEGDILKCSEGHHDYHADISWVGNGFWIKDEKENYHLPNKEYREVIGNIYQNPELLK